MSHKAEQQALECESYPPAQKFALYRIAAVVNDMYEMRWWARNAELAQQIGVTRQTVSGWMQDFVKDGWLEMVNPEKAAGGRSCAVEYRWIGPPQTVGSADSIEKVETVGLTDNTVGLTDNTVGIPDTHRVQEYKGVEVSAPEAQEGTLLPEVRESPIEAEVVTDATIARDITKAFWDTLVAEGRPTPVVGGNRNSYIALVKIVEQFVEAGQTPQEIYNALLDSSVYTLNGITFSLNKQKRESAKVGPDGIDALTRLKEMGYGR